MLVRTIEQRARICVCRVQCSCVLSSVYVLRHRAQLRAAEDRGRLVFDVKWRAWRAALARVHVHVHLHLALRILPRSSTLFCIGHAELVVARESSKLLVAREAPDPGI